MRAEDIVSPAYKMEDKELVSQVLNGSDQALSTLINRNSRLVNHIVSRLIDDKLDREEVSQDVFMKVYQKLGDFNFESKLSTWIATIAYRNSINFLKKKKKYRESDDLDDIEVILEEKYESYETVDTARFIQETIRRLPVHYRTILTLYHIEEFSYPEIVEVTNMPEGTVKNYLFRARKKLKELLVPHLEKEVLLG